jgi:hypothetical protein
VRPAACGAPQSGLLAPRYADLALNNGMCGAQVESTKNASGVSPQRLGHAMLPLMNVAGLSAIGLRAARTVDGVPKPAVSRAPEPRRHVQDLVLRLGSDAERQVDASGIILVGVIARINAEVEFKSVAYPVEPLRD